MKKKLILGLFAVVSVFALAQVKGDAEISSTERKFFGTETTYGDCQDIGGSGHGMQYVTETFYALGIAIYSNTTHQSCDRTFP